VPLARITEIKGVINKLVGRAKSGRVSFNEVSPVEVPPQQFPASTLLFSYPAQSDYGTGGVTENQWRFIQRSYFDYTDPEAAQLEMEALLPALLTEIRRAGPDDLLLPDGTPMELDVEDAGDPDRGEVGEQQMLIKSLYLIARTEET
jgi:hypothetical protein